MIAGEKSKLKTVETNVKKFENEVSKILSSGEVIVYICYLLISVA